MALKKDQLVKVAEELNEVWELDPPFDTELTVADLKTELGEAAEDLLDVKKDSGRITQATLDVLVECGATLPDGLEAKGEERGAKRKGPSRAGKAPKKPAARKRPTPSKKKEETKAKPAPKKKAAPKKEAGPKKETAPKAKGTGRIDRKACAFQAIRQMCKRKNGATKGEVLKKTQEVYYEKGGQAEKYPPLHVLYYSIDALLEFGVLEKDERGQYKFV